jgi:hypothetical protein
MQPVAMQHVGLTPSADCYDSDSRPYGAAQYELDQDAEFAASGAAARSAARLTAVFALALLDCSLLLLLLVVYCSVSKTRETLTFYMVNCAVNLVFFGTYGHLLGRLPGLARCYSTMVSVGLSHMCVVLCITSHRAAKLMDDDDPLVWSEANALTLTCALLMAVPNGVGISLSANLVLLHFVSIAYLVMRLALGSADEDYQGHALGSVLATAQLYFCAILTLFLPGTRIDDRSGDARRRKSCDFNRIVPSPMQQDRHISRQILNSLQATDSHQSMLSSQVSQQDARKMTVPPPVVLPYDTISEEELERWPNRKIAMAMAGKTANWAIIKKMASRIPQRSYSLKQFFGDCLAAFPELQLFYTPNPDDKFAPFPGQVTSALANDAEYQRTIGALFAVYWLLRLEIDGPKGWSYGVDEQWVPVVPNHKGRRSGRGSLAESQIVTSEASKNTMHQSDGGSDSKSKPEAMTEEQKRASFCEATKWTMFEDLLDQAGCGPAHEDAQGRITAILCLTAFHDIMKMEDLLPTVRQEHCGEDGKYKGYKPGDIIGDHDIALSYVLEFYPELLPSYAGLPEDERKVVLFTQSKMQFNHGWFVQAEAPPSMLSTFKQVLLGSRKEDIFFYFLHWFTDLAGAEARPLAGAEMFVLKLPHPVLALFLWSIPYLGKLAHMSETVVMESYLKARWLALAPECDLPEDHDSIAFMRLAVMAQANQAVVDIFLDLPMSYQNLLAMELTRTGIVGQRFCSAPLTSGGPAFLVYYAPAMLQKNVNGNLALAIKVLARVLKTARLLWPVSDEQEGEQVTIMIAALKGEEIETALECESEERFILVRQNDVEGRVEKKTVTKIEELRATLTKDQQLIEADFAGMSYDQDVESKISSEENVEDDVPGPMMDHATNSVNRMRSISVNQRRTSGFAMELEDHLTLDADGSSLCAVSELASIRQQNWLLKRRNDALLTEVSRMRLRQQSIFTAVQSVVDENDRSRPSLVMGESRFSDESNKEPGEGAVVGRGPPVARVGAASYGRGWRQNSDHVLDVE